MRMKSIGKMARAKSPLIGLIATLAGIGVTTALAVNASAKATHQIDEAWDRLPDEEKEDKDDFTLPEKFKLTWKMWVPVMVSGGATVTAAICGYKCHQKQLRAVTALYSAAEASAIAYQQKVLETVGVKKAEEIAGKVVKDKMDKTPSDEQHTSGPIYMDDQHVKFLDVMSGRYFYSTVEHVKTAMNEFNDLLDDDVGLVNELYSDIGIEPVELGNWSGWRKEDAKWRLRWRIYPEMDLDGMPCLAIVPDELPRPLASYY